jgi:pimeloyl-ACP methyl ester carboxylesterase
MTNYLDRPGYRLAYARRAGGAPGVMFCGGLRSDMTGSKALALEAWCTQAGRACVRFDYMGHGTSGGRFEDATLTTWYADALAVLDTLTDGAQVLVGSSMGGWIALLLARARPERIAGLVLIAPAPDFTRALVEALDPDARAALARTGRIERPSAYGPEPYVFTRALLEDGERYCLLDAPLRLRCPVHVVHGTADPDVPWERSLRLLERLEAPEVLITLVKDGDHRLSTPADLERLQRAVAALCGQVGRPPIS